MSNTALQIVADVTASLPSGEMPESIVETIESHKQNLMTLAAALHAAGNKETYIKTVLATSFASFENELSNTLRTLKESGEIK
ncbi:MAG: hypothetical protein AAF950_01005 [Pseudomonadota bacterium]